jgi:hypothetical protein
VIDEGDEFVGAAYCYIEAVCLAFRFGGVFGIFVGFIVLLFVVWGKGGCEGCRGVWSVEGEADVVVACSDDDTLYA